MQEARTMLADRTTWPTTCARGCGIVLERHDRWVLGHVIPRWQRPDLTWVPSNWQPECRPCSDATGQSEALARARAQGRAEAESVFSPDSTLGERRPLPVHTHRSHQEPVEAREGLSWAELCQDAPDWLQPYLEIPEDAAPPLWVSGVHPEATGSLGPEAIEWMEGNLTERGRPLRLRWWQRLAIVLQLQHRADGSLCWRVILESGPRRIGKSVRLRGMALWRLRNGPDLFEDEQLIVHSGKDLAIVREVLRKAWPWADRQPEWDTKRGMTEPEVSYLSVNRWVARSKDATTGYDCCLALVDEAWDVKAAAIDDDLEPSMLERESPQLVLTSTAHRRATSLMRGRISEVLAEFDGETMILLWAMPPGFETGDPVGWRAASPHWSEDRARVMASKHAKALAGEQDPEFDDPDPMQGFRCQYLNSWPLRERQQVKGDPLVSEEDWSALTAVLVSDEPPTSVAVESGFDEGTTLIAAWRLKDGRALLSATDHLDLADAAEEIVALGFRGRVTVGASLLGDPAWRANRLRVVKAMGTTSNAVKDLGRALTEGTLCHDGGEHLSGQVLAVRTTPGTDGPRVVSKTRADALKAAAWALAAARKPSSGRPRFVV